MSSPSLRSRSSSTGTRYKSLHFWMRMQDHLKTIPLQDKTRKLRRIKNCFTGADAITYLAKYLKESGDERFTHVNRAQTCQILNKIMEEGLFLAVKGNEGAFSDSDKHLYCFVSNGKKWDDLDESIDDSKRDKEEADEDQGVSDNGEDSPTKPSPQTPGQSVGNEERLNEDDPSYFSSLLGKGKRFLNIMKREKSSDDVDTPSRANTTSFPSSSTPMPQDRGNPIDDTEKWAFSRSTPRHSTISVGPQSSFSSPLTPHQSSPLTSATPLSKPTHFSRKKVSTESLKSMDAATECATKREMLGHVLTILQLPCSEFLKKYSKHYSKCLRDKPAPDSVFGVSISLFKTAVPEWFAIVVSQLQASASDPTRAFEPFTAVCLENGVSLSVTSVDVCLDTFHNFLLYLPEPIVLSSIHYLFNCIGKQFLSGDGASIKALHYCVYLLPSKHKALLGFVINYLSWLVKVQTLGSLHTPPSLAKKYMPYLLGRVPSSDVKGCTAAVQALIENPFLTKVPINLDDVKPSAYIDSRDDDTEPILQQILQSLRENPSTF